MYYYLGIDEGTTGVTAVLFDEKFTPMGRGYRENTQYYPAFGYVEHDAWEIWQNVLYTAGQALKSAGANAQEVAAIGIDHEGESVVAWNRQTGKPVCPCIVWQDRRTDAECQYMGQFHGEAITDWTGLPVEAYFSASKIAWILKCVPEAGKLLETGNLAVGNMDAFLAWQMSGGRIFATDVSTASRTMLMNLESGQWDSRMLEIWRIPAEILPEIRKSAGRFGDTDPNVFYGARIPIAALLCDQQAALFGSRSWEKGSVKTTYGTGCFMLMNTGDRFVRSVNGLLPTAAWQMDKAIQYALDGSVYTAGAAVQWLRDGLGLIQDASETEKLAESVADTGDVYFVPAFSGLAAPHWNSGARGLLIGMTGGTTGAHIVRAVLESSAFQVCDVAQAMCRDSGISTLQMKCDGGMSRNSFLMQFQANILGMELQVSEFADVTALGAAMAAANGIGVPLPADALPSRIYAPRKSGDWRAERIGRWREAVARAADWVHT